MVRRYQRFVVAALAIVLAVSSAGLASASVLSSHSAVRNGVTTGVVTIAPDGSISPATGAISVSGSTYTLTGELDGSLVVEASGVTINGAGYVINYTVGEAGGDNAALSVNDSSSVVVENIRSSNASVGILANDSPGVSIRGNSALGSDYDIEVSNTSGASVTGNHETGSTAVEGGIAVTQSSNVRVTGNLLDGSVVGVSIYNSSAITIDGNFANATYDYGVKVAQSTNVQVDGNTLEGYAVGATAQYPVYIDDSSYVTANSNQADGSLDGFYADASHDIQFVDDNASYSYYGLSFEAVTNGLMEQDSAYGADYGLTSDGDSNVTLIDNDLAYEREAVSSSYDSDLTISSNYAPWALGTFPAVAINYAAGALIEDNNISHAYEAIALEETYYVTITDNLLNDLSEYGIVGSTTYGPTVVSGNNISGPTGSDAAYGISPDGDYGSWVITGNTIYNLDYAVYESVGEAPVVFDDNVGGGIPDVLIFSEYSYAPLTADNNTFANVNTFYEPYYSYAGAITLDGNVLTDCSYFFYDYEYGYGYTPIVVSGNVADNTTYAVYLYDVDGAVSITNNWFENASEDAIYVDDAYYGGLVISGNYLDGSVYAGASIYDAANVTITDNEIRNSLNVAIEVSDASGGVAIVGNDVRHALYYALELEYIGEGGLTVSGNLASGSDWGLYLDYSDYPSWILGNDFSETNYSYVHFSVLAGFTGNDLLAEQNTSFVSDNIGFFDHNDLNSSAFYQDANLVEGITWNAAYPVGGNFWTGYTGVDDHSGPGQNLSGSDGIGDTPYAIDGATDQYPLVDAWFAATITFQESGLPATSTWSVTFNGQSVTVAAGRSISFAQVNGAFTHFSYQVASSEANYSASTATGSGTENGVSQTISVTFATNASRTLYAVTFNETGLPAGLSWSVTLNGTTQTSTGTSITFHVKSGNYTYSISVPSGYSVSPSSGTLKVSGAPAAVAVKVSSPSTGPSSTTSSNSITSPLSEGLLAGLIAAILAALIGWVLFLRGRKAGGSSSAPPPWQETPPAASPPSPPPPTPPAA